MGVRADILISVILVLHAGFTLSMRMGLEGKDV